MRNYFLYFLLSLALIAFVGMSIVYKSEAHRFFGIANSDAVEINYPYSYRVEQLYVKAGQSIRKGDLLATLIRQDLSLEKKMTTNQLAEHHSEEKLKVNQLKSQIKELDLQYKINMDNLQFTISDLRRKIKINKELLATIVGESHSNLNPLVLQLKQLKRDKNNAIALYKGQKRGLSKELNDQMQLFKNRQTSLDTELQGMKNDEKALVVVAPFDGIVSSINHRVHEEVEAFAPLMLLNDAKPTYVKGYISIDNKHQVHVGQEVKIQPITGLDRNTTVEGRIQSFSANVLPYPSRLKRYQNVEMWGIEVIISVPKNSFILGEKIIVLNEEKKETSSSDKIINYFYQASK